MDALQDRAFNPQHKAVFTINRGAKFSEIIDGTSKTMALAEYLTGTPRDYRGLPVSHRAGLDFIYVTHTPNTSVPDNLLASVPGFCTPAANRPEDNLPCVPGDTASNFASARSRHAGGVYSVLCDGSVQFFADVIDISVWQALGWMQDGSVSDGS
jgi:hypothetical protein